ncbi:NB-ARC domains-containing protein [Artemisia annua]|uniref:NB-ARC domains-containing protein n=1 Tax=Artemisia annua TaxID=35608 RepID=A0A2U1NAR9_ARTAN|nr:NB-ARC domains-containing protein [Artemisia annua]
MELSAAKKERDFYLAKVDQSQALCSIDERQKKWVSELDRLKLHPNEKIQSVLRLSYDALNLHQQNILLDIACVFIGENRDFVISILDGCNFFVDTNMRVLVDKSLITISSNMSLQMHDLIQGMARAIVREESILPRKKRRLLISSNVYEISSQNKNKWCISSSIQ